MKHPIHEHLERRRIYLFRHAQAIDSSAESMAYPGEKPLTPLGRKQASAMGEFVKDVYFDFAVSSDYLRARETAELVLGDRSGMLRISEYFRELKTELKELLGDAQTADEAVKAMVESMWNIPERFKTEVAEGLVQVGKSLEFLLQHEWSVALVAAHSGFNRLFICHVLGMPVKFLSVFEQDYSGMSILELDIDNDKKSLVRAVLRELNVTAYNHAKNDSLLIDIEKVALETRPVMEKMFK